MKQKFIFTLFWCLLSSSLYSAESSSNSSFPSQPDLLDVDFPAVGFPYVVNGSFGVLPASNEDDFIIRKKVDFDNHPNGKYTDSQFKSDWNGGSLYTPNTTQIQTVDGKKVLASFFPKGTYGRGGGLNQWGSFQPHTDKITEIYWTFRIKYQKDFDWALGAKLPGIGFGPVQTVASGGAGPGIGNKGATCRLMQQPDGKLKLYVYHHSMGVQYGDEMGQGMFGQLKRGEWQKLTVRVVANDNGKANGIMQVWLDGTMVASVQNIEMRKASSPQEIGGILLNTFMGGGDSRFAPDKDQYMWMDDVYFWQYSDKYLAENPSVARGLKLHPASHKLYTPLSENKASSNVNPTISLTSPKSDAQFAVGSNVDLTATAADSDGKIAKVEFYNGNTLLGKTTSAPYSFTWKNTKAGDYSITAKATDDKGATATTGVVKIKVASNASPTISLTSPKSDTQFAVGSNVEITAAAADSDGKIAKVEFYNGSTLLGSATSAPYSYTWKNTKAGDYSITAKATDDKGATTTTGVVKIKIAANAGPTVSLTSPETEAEFTAGSNVTISATAADSDGTIAKVEFYNGNTLLGSVTKAPYNYTWSNIKAGAYSITAKATDNKGAITTSGIVKIDVGATKPDENKSNSPVQGVGTQFLDGLVSFYEMNTNTSDVLKDSHGNNHGKNASISHVNGFEEKGNRYDGKSSISQVPHSSSLNLTTEFTLMADVYREGPGQFSGSVIVGKTYSSAWPENEAYSMAITEDNKIRLRTNIGYLNDWFSTQTVPQGKWVRIIATYKSGEGYSLYLDTTTPEKAPKTSGAIYQSNQGLTIGSSVAGHRRRVEGIIDNVGIWNRQLTQAEIAELITTDASYPDFVSGPTNANPTVSLTSPQSESQFADGSSVSLTATASDSDGKITKVEFYNGNTLLGTITSAPYSYSWKNVKAGEYSITAKATDDKGATTTTGAVKIKIASNAGPTVSVTSPKTEAQFTAGSSVSISATAADSDGTIAKVEFYNGSTLLGSVTKAPYNYTWSNVKAGAYSITAKATDNKGASTTSGVVSFKVEAAKTPENKSSLPQPGIGARFLDGLVSFYEMNTNTSGALKDSHGNNHGKNTSISHVNGFEEKGNRYDGKSSISQVPHSSSLNLTTEFTLMADVYREGPGQFSGSVIVGKTYSSAWPENEAYSMAITEDNKIRLRTNIGYLNDWFSTQTVPQGKWVRIIATYKSGEGYSLYMDTTTPEKAPKTSGTIYQSNQGLTIGSSVAGYRRRVEGIIDNVGIWNRQLTQDEIAELITTDASYPDFVSGETYRITMATVTDEVVENDTENSSVVAEPGEKMVFFVEEEQTGEAEFDHWSVDGVRVSDEVLFELDMPKKDILLTKHFKTSEAVEAKRVNTPSGDIPQIRLDYAIGPNPATDHLNIMFTNLDGNYEFQINVVSMSGSVRKTLTVRPEGSSVTIDVSDLSNGIYVLQLSANGHSVANKKFIKL
jgi:hypothetical protein